jgi:predicted hydrocarbon binding protein
MFLVIRLLRVFKFLSDRGLIVNPSDNSRNISLKVETLNKIFDVIYHEVAKISDSNTALGILKKAGYESGKKFGDVMNNKWELEQNDLSINHKISKWCEFDSDVGWGKLINEIHVDEDQGEISGSLVISENFQADNRRKNDPLICDYIKGYAEGVLEELLGGLQIEMACEMDKCPLHNPFKKKCYCNVKVKS